jgi:predicted transcriptional regulator
MLQPKTAKKRGRPPKRRSLTLGPTVSVEHADKEQQNETRKEELLPLEAEQEDDRKPYLTIGQLKSASTKPVSVRRNDPVEKAITTMLMQRVSYLPVLQQNDRVVDGMVTWEAIGKKRAAGKECASVQDCMDTNVRALPRDTPLFDAVRDIIRYGAVVVQAKDRTVCGLVTAADIAGQFVELSEPFLFLEQIENHLRGLLRRVKMNQEELRQLVDPTDVERLRKTITVDKLTFGEYLRGFQQEWVWGRLGLGIDRKLFLGRIYENRDIRNSVMHFHPDPLTLSERDTLATTRELLQNL